MQIYTLQLTLTKELTIDFQAQSNIALLKVKKFRKGQGGNLDFLNKDGEDDLNQGNTTHT